MPFQNANGIRQYYERTGSGEPMVLVHGSWGDHHNWAGALLDGLGLAPARIVGNSGGAIIALRMASKPPELFRSNALYEPPLIDLLDGRPAFRPMRQGFNDRVRPVTELLEAGENAAGAERFVNAVAFWTWCLGEVAAAHA